MQDLRVLLGCDAKAGRRLGLPWLDQTGGLLASGLPCPRFAAS